MRILQIETVWANSGLPRIVRNLVEYVNNNGGESVFAFGRCITDISADAVSYTHKIGNMINVYADYAISTVLDNAGFNSKQSTREFIRWIDDYNPDLIHLHSLVGYYINVEILFDYLKKSGKPVVWTQHDCWAFTGHCINYEMYNCRKWMQENGCCNCSQRKTYPKSIIIDNSERNYVKKKKTFTSLDNIKLVTPSEWLAGEVRKSFLKCYDVLTIPNGLDLQMYSPRKTDLRGKYQLENKRIILAVAATWTEKKGIEDIIRLSSDLDGNNALVVIGLTPIQEKLFGNNLISIPRITDNDILAQWYSEADVLVQPSKEESFGMVAIEAMACGTPVVAYRVTAIPEVVADGAGVTVDAGDYELFKKYALEYKKDVNACIKSAMKFDVNSCNEKYFNLYHSMLSQ